jgi:hypothetical protein
MAGFGKKSDSAAERSLEKSTRELRMLRKVIEQYKDDPKGRAKMMKKMKRYWSSNVATIKNLDYQPKGAAWRPDQQLIKDLEGLTQDVKSLEDPRETEGDSIDNLTEQDMSAIRDMLSKDKGETADDQSGPEIPGVSEGAQETQD